jgi:hypothetical protein
VVPFKRASRLTSSETIAIPITTESMARSICGAPAEWLKKGRERVHMSNVLLPPPMIPARRRESD